MRIAKRAVDDLYERKSNDGCCKGEDVEVGVSAYLGAVGATVERRGGFVADPKRKGIVVHQDKEARVVTDWKPLTDMEEEG